MSCDASVWKDVELIWALPIRIPYSSFSYVFGTGTYDIYYTLMELWSMPFRIIHAISNVFSSSIFFVDWMYCPFAWILSIMTMPLSWFGLGEW